MIVQTELRKQTTVKNRAQHQNASDSGPVKDAIGSASALFGVVGGLPRSVR
jgi:hypothetical protein